jgi:hypothetical protein
MPEGWIVVRYRGIVPTGFLPGGYPNVRWAL